MIKSSLSDGCPQARGRDSAFAIIKQFLNIIINYNELKNTLEILTLPQDNINFVKMNPEPSLMSGTADKKVYQFKLGYYKESPPYKQMNPFSLLNQLNKVVKQKYDMEFIHVKYLMTKNKDQKYLNQHYASQKQFQIDPTVNNIFTLQCEESSKQFLRNVIFGEAEKLKPPADYNPDDAEKYQNEIKGIQRQKLQQIKNKIKGLMKVYNSTNQSAEKIDSTTIATIQGFRSKFDKQLFTTNDYQIYVKALMNKPVYERIEQDQKEKGKTLLQIKQNQKIFKLYLNPSKNSKQFDYVNDQYRINNWSLNCHLQDVFTSYFGTEDLIEKLKKKQVNSVRLVSSISFNQVVNYSRAESFSIMTFLWNQTVMKIVVKLAQIRKIQKASKDNQHQYYFHLTYPPMFYISQLKVDQASSEKYMKFYDRVPNFLFLQGQHTKKNYFLRYFLFNNSILRINIKVDNSLQGGDYFPVSQTYEKLENLYSMFTGTIQCQVKQSFYNKKYNLKFWAQKMDFKKFKDTKMLEQIQQNKDKIWTIKYLILSMVRFNYIIPTGEQINPILKCIQQDKKNQSIDCYLYVLWRAATKLLGYTTQNLKFHEFFIKQVQQVKKMNLKDIMTRLLQASDQIVYIFRVSLTPSGLLFNPPTPEMKGRLLKQFVDYSQFFLRVSLSQESQVDLKNQKYITRVLFRQHMDQIEILGRGYKPLGWSPSQLRSFSLWYFHPISGRKYQSDGKVLQKLQRRYILQFLGDFKKIQNPAKKAARIGQSFSSSWTYKSNDLICQQIDDVYSNEGVNFTDGIGKISEDLLEKISLRLNIRDLTVIQVRYKGAKGVLALDPELGENQIQLRHSMIKYVCQDKNAQKYLDILDWNKYKSGFLNRQIIILLRTLGVQNKVFIGLQQQHINRISKMTFKDCSIFKHMGDDLNTEILNLQPANKTILSLLNAGFQLQKQPFFRGVLQTLKKNGYFQLKMKSNIRIQKSARIIGIIDQCGVLEQNQVYCAVHDHFFIEKPIKQIVEGQAIITRNPCLHPADIRIVRCVGQHQIQQRFQKLGKPNRFKNFWNVVIMPIKGKYPLTSQISGSDLDGDNFFICWDDRLIPKNVHPPVLIDDANKAKKQQKKIVDLTQQEQYKRMLDFFIDYTNYQKLGQIDNSHLVHADRDLQSYAYNTKCIKLAMIHGKAVDFPKTGYCPPVDSQLFCSQYPDFMQKQNVTTYISQSILGKLYRDIKEQIQNLLQDKVYTNVNQIDKTLIFDYKYDQSLEEVEECIELLRQYQRQMTNLISILGVDSQYEIYSGNFSTVKNRVKIFGKNRLIATILSLRTRFFRQFFQGLQDQDKNKYNNIVDEQKHMTQGKYFGENTRRKAQLYYLVSYIRKFSDLKEQTEGFTKLKQKIDKVLEKLKIINIEEKYCGFVWFIIPKIILNLKITWREMQNNNHQHRDENNQIIEEQEEQDGYI